MSPERTTLIDPIDPARPTSPIDKALTMIDTWNSYNPYLNTQPFLSEAAEEVRLLVTRTVIPDVRDVADHLCDIADHLSYYTIDTTPGTVTHIPTDNNNEEN